MLSIICSLKKAIGLTGFGIILNRQIVNFNRSCGKFDISSNALSKVSRYYSASPVYVVAEKNSPTLAPSMHWERSADLMQVLLRHKRLHTHCNFNIVKEATELLDQCDMLDESNARLLISSCGKTMSFYNEQKSHQAQHIFKLARNKSIGLANELLRVQLENSVLSDPQQVLKRLDELHLTPNEDTIMQLIASACLSGNIHTAKDILMLCNEYEFEIPWSIYGHFACSFGKAGKTEWALKLIDQLLLHHKNLSWDVFSLFIQGIAKSDIVLEEILKKYHSHLKYDMTMPHFVDICKEFWQHGKTFDVELLTKYFSSNPRISDVIHAAHHLSKYSYDLAAPCLTLLLSRSSGFINLNDLVQPLKILVKHSIKSGDFDDIWNTVLLLKKFNKNNTDIATEFLTLSILIKENCHCEKFYEKLCKNGVEFEVTVPHYLKRPLRFLKINVAEVERFLEKQQIGNDADEFQATAF